MVTVQRSGCCSCVNGGQDQVPYLVFGAPLCGTEFCRVSWPRTHSFPLCKRETPRVRWGRGRDTCRKSTNTQKAVPEGLREKRDRAPCPTSLFPNIQYKLGAMSPEGHKTFPPRHRLQVNEEQVGVPAHQGNGL